MVSRGDSTLRGHFPGDLVSLEKGMGGEWWRAVSDNYAAPENVGAIKTSS